MNAEKDADGVAAAVDAGNDGIGEATGEVLDLVAGFAADDALELAHDLGVGVRTGGGAEESRRWLRRW